MAALTMAAEAVVMVCLGAFVVASTVLMVTGVAGLAFAGGIVYTGRHR